MRRGTERDLLACQDGDDDNVVEPGGVAELFEKLERTETELVVEELKAKLAALTSNHKSNDRGMMTLDTTDGVSEDILQLQEFTRGLQEDLLGSVVDGLVQGLG